jgi:hypothetical protein
MSGIALLARLGPVLGRPRAAGSCEQRPAFPLAGRCPMFARLEIVGPWTAGRSSSSSSRTGFRLADLAERVRSGRPVRSRHWIVKLAPGR